MKKITTILILTLLLTSCSDNLTNSKAEGIIRECLEKNPKYGTINFKTGEIRFNTERKPDLELIEKYKNLAIQGYILFDLKKTSKKYITYKVSFTDKAKDFVLETGKQSGFGLAPKNITITKVYDYELLEAKEIREMSITAEVDVTYKKINKTPFYNFEKQFSDFINMEIRLYKRTNDGWKYCE